MVVLFQPAIFFDHACAQSCDDRLRPVENWQIKYRQRDNDNRCEGYYRSNVSTGTLEVVGVILGKLNFKMDKAETLQISSPVVRDRTINVRGVGIPLKTYYRMDAQINIGAELKWPIKDVIYHKKLSAKNIGIYGWIGEGSSMKYVPVRAVPSLIQMERSQSLSILFRSSVNVETVKWRIANIKNGSVLPAGEWKDAKKSNYKFGETIYLTLPQGNADEVLVEVAARDVSSGEWLKRVARVIVNQQNEN